MVNAAMTALALLPPRHAVSTEAPATTGATAAYMDANPRATPAVRAARRATLAISAVIMGIVHPTVGSAATMEMPAVMACIAFYTTGNKLAARTCHAANTLMGPLAAALPLSLYLPSRPRVSRADHCPHTLLRQCPEHPSRLPQRRA
jgi:hypothetical protein